MTHTMPKTLTRAEAARLLATAPKLAHVPAGTTLQTTDMAAFGAALNKTPKLRAEAAGGRILLAGIAGFRVEGSARVTIEETDATGRNVTDRAASSDASILRTTIVAPRVHLTGSWQEALRMLARWTREAVQEGARAAA